MRGMKLKMNFKLKIKCRVFDRRLISRFTGEVLRPLHIHGVNDNNLIVNK